MSNQTVKAAKMNQRQLLRWITMLGFCHDDMVLYLDTHPDDTDALAYANQCAELLRNAVHTYEEQYGMLTVKPDQNVQEWNWVQTPWPGEGGYQ